MPTIHKMEQELRERGAGVYGEKMQAAPKNKMAEAPANKTDLRDMLKKELIATAEAEGVEYESDDNKADLVRKIEAARA